MFGDCSPALTDATFAGEGPAVAAPDSAQLVCTWVALLILVRTARMSSGSGLAR